MIQAKLTWHGDPVIPALKAAAWEKLARAVVFFWSTLQTVLNVPNPPPYQTPSAPGEAPRKRTGWLASHVLYELDKAGLAGRVGLGPAAKYGLFLEAGTRKMAARPWFLATLKKILPQLEALMR